MVFLCCLYVEHHVSWGIRRSINRKKTIEKLLIPVFTFYKNYPFFEKKRKTIFFIHNFSCLTLEGLPMWSIIEEGKDLMSFEYEGSGLRVLLFPYSIWQDSNWIDFDFKKRTPEAGNSFKSLLYCETGNLFRKDVSRTSFISRLIEIYWNLIIICKGFTNKRVFFFFIGKRWNWKLCSKNNDLLVGSILILWSYICIPIEFHTLWSTFEISFSFALLQDGASSKISNTQSMRLSFSFLIL